MKKTTSKKKTESTLKKYKKHKNYCRRLYKKECKFIFDNLHPEFVTDNKLFWKTIKPFISNKINNVSNIKLSENDKIIHNDHVAENMNLFFKSVLSSLDININSDIFNYVQYSITDPIERVI
mgnify:FL=1